MSNSAITRLPIEIIETIFGLIHSPSDLLSVGLTCRAFSSLIIPSHIHYRIIHIERESLAGSGIWWHICKNPFLANNIRMLEFGMGLERIPPLTEWWSGAEVLPLFRVEAEEESLQALGLMGALLSFKVLTEWLPGHWLKKAWDILNRITTLQELHVTSHSGYSESGERDLQMKQRFEAVHTKLFSLRWPSLTSVTLVLHISEDEELGVPSLTSFLLSCVHLTDLLLQICSVHREVVDLSSLFSQARWLSLKQLEVSEVSAIADVVRSFIVAHPLLERIVCYSSGFVLKDLPVGSLPNLRSFGGHFNDEGDHFPALAHLKPPLLEEITHIHGDAEIRTCEEYLMVFKPTLRQLRFYYGADDISSELISWLQDNLPEVELL